jgi:glutamyl-tRNA(Gln) amidotransferase subunit D
MKIKELSAGDRVKLLTKDREWEGWILESYNPEIILVKLKTGYNIGLREEDILNVRVIEKVKGIEKKKRIEKNPALPNVGMIITGGTISSRLDSKSGGVIYTGAEEILEIAPKIKEICNITRIERPFMKWSENMSYKDWKKIAECCEDMLSDSSLSGIIITHGTDFLHYTSIALSFFIKNLNKPIALTYSQRSIDRASTDASLNLFCAARYAVSDIAEIAIIGHKNENDSVCLAMPGTKVRKMHTSRRDAFKIINSQAIAEISEKEFKILREFNARNDSKPEIDTKFEEDIALIQIYPGQDPEILEFYKKKGYKGIILEIAGIGQVPAQDARYNWLPKIKKAIQEGLVICATPQTLYGRLDTKVYSAGRDLEKTGIIVLEDMLPETAFVKLGFVLAHKDWIKNKETIKQKMLENFSGEFNKRLLD